MGSPCPPHWSFAARAAYFGDRLCAFCDHRNPPGARFCNECSSPLELKPCRQCDAVNEQDATTCHSCGAAYPLSAAPESVRVSATADPALGGAPSGDAPLALSAPDARDAGSALRSRWRTLRSREFIATAVAVVLIVAYQAYRANVSKPDAVHVASQPAAAGITERDATAPATAAEVALVLPVPAESQGAEDVLIRVPDTDVDAPERAAVRRTSPPVAARPRANAQQRSASERQVPVARTASVAHRPPAARTRAQSPKASTAQPPDRWQRMHASLAQCDGDVVARVVCDQRVRRQFCDGHWDVAPHCASGIANEHGQ